MKKKNKRLNHSAQKSGCFFFLPKFSFLPIRHFVSSQIGRPIISGYWNVGLFFNLFFVCTAKSTFKTGQQKWNLAFLLYFATVYWVLRTNYCVPRPRKTVFV